MTEKSDYRERRRKIQAEFDRGIITEAEFISAISLVDADEFDAKSS